MFDQDKLRWPNVLHNKQQTMINVPVEPFPGLPLLSLLALFALLVLFPPSFAHTSFCAPVSSMPVKDTNIDICIDLDFSLRHTS